MKSLWFKQKFVEPILRGEKTCTVRKPSKRLPAVGEVVAFQVGPKPPFCRARVKMVQLVTITQLPEAHQQDLRACFPCEDGELFARIDFTVEE